MSEVMLLGVLRCPVETSDPIAIQQLQQRAKEAAARIEADAILIECKSMIAGKLGCTHPP